jgi:transposase
MDTRMTKRRNFSDSFKAAVALESLRGDKTVQEIVAKRQLHPTQVSTWKRQAIEVMAGVFSDKVKRLRIASSMRGPTAHKKRHRGEPTPFRFL